MKKKHVLELQRISASIPKDLTDRLMKTELVFPTLREIAMRAQTDDSVSAEDKRKYKAMLDSGYLDRTADVIDEDIEKQISDYVDSQIEKAVKLGRLPKKRAKPLTAKALRNERRKKTREPAKASDPRGDGENA